MTEDARERRTIAVQANQLGNEHWKSGRPDLALEHFETAYCLLNDWKGANQEKAVESASNYALCLLAVGDIPAAERIFAKGVELAEAANISARRILRQWAYSKEHMNLFVEARALYERAQPRKEDAPLEHLAWHHAMGGINWREGRLSEARSNYEFAKSNLPDDPEEAATVLPVLGNTALLFWELGEDAKAMRLAEKMHDIVDRAKNNLDMKGTVNLMRVNATRAKRRGDLKSEIAIWNECHRIVRETTPNAWSLRLDIVDELVSALKRGEQFDDAIRLVVAERDAMLGGEFPYVWLLHLILASLFNQIGEIAKARASMLLVIADFVGEAEPKTELPILSLLAQVAQAENRPDAAIFIGKLALAHLAVVTGGLETSEIHKVIIEGQQISDATIELLNQKGRFDEAAALTRLEARIRYLAHVNRDPRNPVEIEQPVPQREFERAAEKDWMRARGRLVDARRSGNSAALNIAAKETLEVLLSVTEPSAKNTAPAVVAEPPSVHTMRLTLTSDTNTVSAFAESHVSSRHIRIYTSAPDINRATADLIFAINDKHAWRDPAKFLYQSIVAPFEQDLLDCNVLEIDAAGSLSRIPFALLASTGRLLCQRFAIINLISAAGSRHGNKQSSKLVHLTDAGKGPLVDFSTWPDAFGTQQKFKTNIIPVFSREDLRSALDAGVGYLSIATHFNSEPDRPDLWALSLGDGTKLHLTELATHSFDFSRTKLVSFVACGSATSESISQDCGLVRLALEGGAESVIGTIWDISETAAATFTRRFWPLLASDPNRDAAAALRKFLSECADTQVSRGGAVSTTGGIGIMPDGPPPSEWAGFQLYQTRSINE
jgi:CHAT domain-containing protein